MARAAHDDVAALDLPLEERARAYPKPAANLGGNGYLPLRRDS